MLQAKRDLIYIIHMYNIQFTQDWLFSDLQSRQPCCYRISLSLALCFSLLYFETATDFVTLSNPQQKTVQIHQALLWGFPLSLSAPAMCTFIPLLCLWWNLNEKAEGHCVVFHHPPIPAQPPCYQGNCTVGGSALWVKIPFSLFLSLEGYSSICARAVAVKKRPLDPLSRLSVWL